MKEHIVIVAPYRNHNCPQAGPERDGGYYRLCGHVKAHKESVCCSDICPRGQQDRWGNWYPREEQL